MDLDPALPQSHSIELTSCNYSTEPTPAVITKKPSRLAEVTTNLRYAFQGWWHYDVQLTMDSLPAYLLGMLYHSEAQLSMSSGENFQINFQNIPWLTYRTGFRPIYSVNEKTGTMTEITSDVGWGCTIRVGQMMLLTTLKRSMCNYRKSNFNLLKCVQEYWPEAPYSLHRVAEVAKKLNKQAGDWFAPSDMSFIIEVPHK